MWIRGKNQQRGSIHASEVVIKEYKQPRVYLKLPFKAAVDFYSLEFTVITLLGSLSTLSIDTETPILNITCRFLIHLGMLCLNCVRSGSFTLSW